MPGILWASSDPYDSFDTNRCPDGHARANSDINPCPDGYAHANTDFKPCPDGYARANCSYHCNARFAARLYQ
ncbi:MAG: hypothetical protein ACETWR_19905 [Anaerolineae bacterium]